MVLTSPFDLFMNHMLLVGESNITVDITIERFQTQTLIYSLGWCERRRASPFLLADVSEFITIFSNK